MKSVSQLCTTTTLWCNVNAADVGGFMGLLLGGSCLTLCELLDLVAFKLLETFLRHQRMRRRQERENRKKQIKASAQKARSWMQEV